MGQIVGIFLYIFTVVTTLALLGGLPIALLSLLMEYRRTRRNAPALAIALLIAAGFVAGGAAGWAFRPFEWHMPLWETAKASVNAADYGH